MNLEHRVTRPEEELQTLQRFVQNQGRNFFPEKAIQDRMKIKEPADVFYEETEYQITYGDTTQLASLRKVTSLRRKDDPNLSERFVAIRGLSSANYAEMCLKNALVNKKIKSDKNMILLIDCTYTSYRSLQYRENLCKQYFNDNKLSLGGSWGHIFAVFPDGNIFLR